MLTFRPIEVGFVMINREMTGYWDLGLCIPFRKYLLANESSKYIRIDTYDKNSLIVKGEFKLTFRFETDTTRIASFSNGTFLAKVDSTYPFRYCIEG